MLTSSNNKLTVEIFNSSLKLDIKPVEVGRSPLIIACTQFIDSAELYNCATMFP